MQKVRLRVLSLNLIVHYLKSAYLAIGLNGCKSDWSLINTPDCGSVVGIVLIKVPHNHAWSTNLVFKPQTSVSTEDQFWCCFKFQCNWTFHCSFLCSVRRLLKCKSSQAQVLSIRPLAGLIDQTSQTFFLSIGGPCLCSQDYLIFSAIFVVRNSADPTQGLKQLGSIVV